MVEINKVENLEGVYELDKVEYFSNFYYKITLWDFKNLKFENFLIAKRYVENEFNAVDLVLKYSKKLFVHEIKTTKCQYELDLICDFKWYFKDVYKVL